MERVGDDSMEEQKDRLMQLAGRIEQLAIQFGIPAEDAGVWTETFFQKYQAEHRMDEELDKVLVYRSVYERLSMREPTLMKELFRFEEDNELLGRLTDLPIKMKSVILLSHFHGLSLEEIAHVTGLDEQDIYELEREGIVRFNDQLIEKKLSLLQKSFERIRPSFRYDQLFQPQSVVLQSVQSIPKKHGKYKKTIYLWTIALLLLVAVSFFWITSSTEYKAASSAKFIAKLEKSFDKEFQDRLEQSGLESLIEREPMMMNYLYNKDIRKEFDMFLFNLNRVLENEGHVDKKKALKQYDEYIEEIKLPSEVAEQLFSRPVKNNWEESEQFVERYIDKLFRMQGVYMYALSSGEFLELSDVEGIVDGETFLPTKGSISDELMSVLKGMESQNFFLTSIRGSYPTPLFGTNEYSDRLIRSVHPDFGVYIKLYQYDFYKMIDSPNQSLNVSVDYLKEMENLLLKSERKKDGPDYLYGAYTWLFMSILGMDSQNAIGPDHRVKKEYREAWRQVASLGSDSPAASIVAKIVQEMESDGWFYSPYYEELIENGIYRDLDQAMSRFAKRPE
ncbi:hypothetical protein [Sporosarcina sp. Te-1]|uniref:hypothetical protein n=1 Tax=Sporosarcina sp. Te-1 TaxID=2818390 RepID=UPI001A9D36A0|nr:hypothetical protein [Sporosarcina sp. Te-1]QTD42680.1 hypothetical protein J3U78_07860 [Sporosarcina sp. Te-1]